MRVLNTVGGVLILGLGVLLCILAGYVAWQLISFPGTVSSPGSLPRNGSRHSDFILIIGSRTLSGWQLWALPGGLAGLGVLLAIVALYLLLPPQSSP
jgi:uncharacterized membrane protein